MLRSYRLALLLVTLAATGCSDLPDTIEPKPAAAGSGGAGAATGKSGAGGATAADDAGTDEDASS